MASNNTLVTLAVSLLACAVSACATTTPLPQQGGLLPGAGGSAPVIAEPLRGASPVLDPGPEPEACVDDSQCAPNLVCREVIIAACSVCAGGRMVRTCAPPVAVPPPVVVPPPVAVPDDCPRHVDCMPPLQPGEVCPPPGLMERCPGTSVTW